MSSVGVIGHEPVVQRVVLIEGQDLTHLFIPHTPLPSGSVLEWRAYDRDWKHLYGVWPVTDETLTEGGWLLNVEASDHAVIPDGSRHRLFATYPTGGRYCWIAGPIGRSRR